MSHPYHYRSGLQHFPLGTDLMVIPVTTRPDERGDLQGIVVQHSTFNAPPFLRKHGEVYLTIDDLRALLTWAERQKE